LKALAKIKCTKKIFWQKTEMKKNDVFSFRKDDWYKGIYNSKFSHIFFTSNVIGAAK